MTPATIENRGGNEPCDYVTLATPAGRAAIATVLLDGPQAIERVDALFQAASRRALRTTPVDRIVFGKWKNDEGQAEELVVCRRSDRRVEIHCHGGTAAPEAIIASLVNTGCQRLDWPQWLQTTDGDALAVEAQIALSKARTERTAEILLAQYNGALARTLASACRHLRADEPTAAGRILGRMLSLAEVGLHLTRSWQLVLAGSVNVGKSSLVNAILGYDRAIVFDQPGTTRDVVSADTAIDGWPVEISDTAGLRDADDIVEAIGVQAATIRAASADLLVLLSDASAPWNDADEALCALYPDALLVHNKCDLSCERESRPPGIYVSALRGDAVEDLIQQIVQRLVSTVPHADEAVPFTERQVQLLSRASQCVGVDDRQQAIMLLQEIRTGRPQMTRGT